MLNYRISYALSQYAIWLINTNLYIPEEILFWKSFLTETENRFIYEITSPGICKKPAIHEIGPPKFKWFHSSLQVFIFKKLIGGILGKIKKYYTMVNKCSVFLRHCHNKGIRYLILFSIEVICENWVYSLLLILQ